MSGELQIRTATREDNPRIIELLNFGFRTPMDPATWEWYIYGNPLGNSRVYVAGEKDGGLVGVICFAPISLLIEGVPTIADFAHHLVLTAEHRNTLSFVALNRYALNAQAALGIKLVIGPPNRTAYPIHKKLMKWVDYGYLECIRKLKPAARPHACQIQDRFDDSFDAFYATISVKLRFCFAKDTAWMNWRFCSRPGSPYTLYTLKSGSELAGYVVLKRWQDPSGYRKAHMVDLHARDTEALTELLAAAETYADGLDELNLWAIQGYLYRSHLLDQGFFVDEKRQPLIARPYDRTPLRYPEGPTSLAYGDGDTLY